MLREIVTGPQAWDAETAGQPDQWYFQLPGSFVAAAANSVDRLPNDIGDVASLPPVEELPLARERHALFSVHETLERGRGFVVLRGAMPAVRTPPALRAMFWLIGQLLGRPLAQNARGEVLYDVRDTGQDVRYGARFSVTNAESTFHTDNSFGGEVADYVGLLCLHAARSGGLSQLVSGYAVHNELRRQPSSVLERLYQPLHVDRRGGVRPGESPTTRVPVFACRAGELLCRYLRYWIEVGQDKAGEPLAPGQTAALDTLDAVLADVRLRVEFALQPGDICLLNNRWLFHNRTAFEDHAEPERRRHLVRLWLARRGPIGDIGRMS